MNRQLKPLLVERIGEKDGYDVYQNEEMLVLVRKDTPSDKFFRSEKHIELGKLPLAERMKKLRESLNLTQRDFAALCGITQGEVSAIEREITRPGDDIKGKIMKATGVDLLFFEEEK